MKSLPIALFGVPIHNFTLDEIVNTCIEHLVSPSSSSHPFFIHPVSLTNISEVLGWRPHVVKDPELLRMLRSGNMNIAQHNGLQWASYALGSSLKPSIDIQELLLKLCTELGTREKGVFILGSKHNINKAAAVNLHEMCPGLRIVGIVNTSIYIDGEHLTYAEEKDNLLVEQINATKADLLLLAFKEREQTLWIERVRHKLKIPLILCIGSALEALLPAKQTPPKTDSEKDVHTTKNITKNLLTKLKALGITMPLAAYHRINSAVFKLLYQKEKESYAPTSLLFLSQERSIAIVALPKNIDNSTIQPLSKLLEDAQMHNILILDFRPVRHIQPEGFALLLNYCRKQRQKNHQFYGFAPTSDIILLMQLHRTWDYFKNNICLSTECLLSRIGHGPNGAEFFDSIYQHGDEVEISFFGALNNAVDYEAYFYKLVPILEGKNCLLDFSYCTYIDTSGFIFLLKIRHLMLDTLKELHIRNLNKSTLAQFKRAKVDSLFRID